MLRHSKIEWPATITSLHEPSAEKTHDYCGTLLIKFTAVIFWPMIANQNDTYSIYHFHYSRQYSPRTSRLARITSTETLSLSLTRQREENLDQVIRPLTEKWDRRLCLLRNYPQFPRCNLLSMSWPLLKKWRHRFWWHLCSRLCSVLYGWSLMSQCC